MLASQQYNGTKTVGWHKIYAINVKIFTYGFHLKADDFGFVAVSLGLKAVVLQLLHKFYVENFVNLQPGT